MNYKTLTSLRIFLSYGRDEHVTLARRMKEDLEARGHQVWFDESRIVGGHDWEIHIEKALDWCAEIPHLGRFILLMTPHSVRRPDGFCLNELAAAINRRLIIIPVMVVWCEPPLYICRIQWLDMRDCIPVTEKLERYELRRQRLFEALEQGEVDFEGSQSLLVQQLNPLDFTAELARYTPKFVGRKWVLKKIRQWLKDPGPQRIFWIVGPPGVGKTALAAYLCERMREVVAFHLCRYGHEDKSDPGRCVKSLAYQLSCQLPDYFQLLIPRLGDLNRSAATLFDNLIVQPLRRIKRIPRERLVILIDGLDEVSREGRNELAEFLAQEFPRTPDWLLLVLTSRPDPEVVRPMQGLIPFFLSMEGMENLNDLSEYITVGLRSWNPESLSDPSVVDEILEKSGGLFLVAEQIIESLRQGVISISALDEFPQGLGGYYNDFFRRQFPNVSRYKERFRPLLEMILAAHGPLPLSLAQKALNWGPYDFYLNAKGEAQGEILTPLGSLFQCDGELIRPFHHSLAEWLTAPVLAGEYFVQIREGQQRLAEVCFSEYRAGIKEMSSYAKENLAGHLLEVSRLDDLLLIVEDPKLGLIRRWVEGGDGKRGLVILKNLVSHLREKRCEFNKAAALATQMARIFSLQGLYTEAEQWLRWSMNAASWWHGARIRAVAMHELGSLALYKGELESASQWYRRALRVCHFTWPPISDEISANLIGLATIAFMKSNYIETISFAKRAIAVAEKAHDFDHRIAGERITGAALKALGKWEEAKRQLEKAVSMAHEFGLKLEEARLLLLKGWLLHDLAILSHATPRDSKALFLKALKLAEELGDFYCKSEALLSAAWMDLEGGDTAAAMKIFEQLAVALTETKHQELFALLNIGIARVASLQGRYEESRALFRQMVDFCRQHNPQNLWRAYVWWGELALREGNKMEAEILWEKTLEAAGRISPGKIQLAQAIIANWEKP